MKKVTVLAKFPEVIVDGYSVESKVTAEASTFKAAVSRAIGQALRAPELKRKRIKKAVFEVSVED